MHADFSTLHAWCHKHSTDQHSPSLQPAAAGACTILQYQKKKWFRCRMSLLQLLDACAGQDSKPSTFWASQARVRRAKSELGSTVPRKMGLNWFMPALVKRRVGSFRGTTLLLGTAVCPLVSKNSMNAARTRSAAQPTQCRCQGSSTGETKEHSSPCLCAHSLR